MAGCIGRLRLNAGVRTLMSSDPIVLEREWFAVAPDGAEHALLLRVSRPIQLPRGEWSATASVGVLDPTPHEIAGMDSWQAVDESMRFIAIRVRHFQERGWQFFWERGGEVASPSDLARAV